MKKDAKTAIFMERKICVTDAKVTRLHVNAARFL